MKVRLNRLLLVEERLLEADYFARRVSGHRGQEVLYDLNAFLSAARSVTFLMQKAMADVEGFRPWWELQQTTLGADHAAKFFLKLRNFSQKEGRAAVVGGAWRSGSRTRWTHRFAGNAEPVPESLLDRDVSECCREHVAKLARLILACTDEFPYQTSLLRALTPDGLAALGVEIGDIEETFGYPRGWTLVGSPGPEELAWRLGSLASKYDELDFTTIERLGKWKPRRVATKTRSGRISDRMLASLVNQLEACRNPSQQYATQKSADAAPPRSDGDGGDL